jgi:hypothetical protein
MKKKKFADPLINPTEELFPMDSGGPGSNNGGDNVNVIRPLPMSFDEWTQSSFCIDLDGSGNADFGDYTNWWNSNGFGEENVLAYNPELAATEVAPDLGTDVIGEDILG